MRTRPWARRTAASAATLVAVLALTTAPAQAANPSDCAQAATVVRTPQVMVLADGESGTKRPL
ncbi:hypothetical protein ABZW11_25435 [Nonomuraea sp. NPDC004580]|uniref:hypothetical protein n=1 Tax=Nonomuraea sp. NPDC004580 TaxID=3154552 RepID=UPI0033AF3799